MAVRKMSSRKLSAANWGGSSPVDPYFNSVIALLHGNGADGSTTITDNSPLALNWTRSGVTVSTAQSKFGGASLYWNGNHNLTPPSGLSSYTIGTADNFCFEMWLYPTNFSATNFVLDFRGGASSQFLVIDSGTNGRLRLDGTSIGAISSPLLTINSWNHLAITRNSGTLRVFVNGTQGASVSDSNAWGIGGSSRPVIGNSSGGGEQFYGHMDDIRITRGEARYTSAFTVPSAAFPDR